MTLCSFPVPSTSNVTVMGEMAVAIEDPLSNLIFVRMSTAYSWSTF